MLHKYLAIMISLIVFAPVAAEAQTSKLDVSESTKYYKIRGRSASEFAYSMTKNGPYSREHGRRAWATATRDMTYQLFHRKSKKNCSIKAVRVKMKITYEMPKLASTRGVSKRQQSNWKKMFGLMNKHERTHGLFYRQFAGKVYASLKKLRPASSCRHAALWQRFGRGRQRRHGHAKR